MKRAAFDFVAASVAVVVVATALLVVGLAGSVTVPAAHVVAAHVCPPAC